MSEGRENSILKLLRNSDFVKIILIGFLVLLLQIPIVKIKAIIKERDKTRQDAIKEVTAKWGMAQSIIGPTIVVPYINRQVDSRGQRQMQSQVTYATFLPELLKISGRIDSELRYRGIFEIPVYKMSLDLSGRFLRPDFSQWSIEPNDIFWDRAYLSIYVSDAPAITKSPTLSWNNKELGFLPGAGEIGSSQQGIHVKLAGHLDRESFDFSFPLELNGSISVFFTPFGRDTEVQINSNWCSPSFQGNWLPVRRTVDSDGFRAAWNIPFLSRNYPQSWKSSFNCEQAISSSLFGVDMISPVDHYRMSERSVKYHILFLVLTFVTLWLFEILIKIRIHPVQYLLTGAGMCLFYLLELSLAEHFGFILAYIIASAAIVVLVTSYSAAVLRSNKRAVAVGMVLILLYVYLYILLMIQDYALLVGSIGLFIILATIMFLTRKVDWYSLKGSSILKVPVDDKAL